jgi:hypothetical protein
MAADYGIGATSLAAPGAQSLCRRSKSGMVQCMSGIASPARPARIGARTVLASAPALLPGLLLLLRLARR